MMTLIRTATAIIVMMMVITPYQSAHAQKCSDVCPNETRSGCWTSGISKNCKKYGPITMNQRQCFAWCSCNMFGRNCDPCASCNRGLVDITTLDEVDDYSEYLAYSDNEKMVELSDTVCPEGKVAASYDLHRTLESLADTNNATGLACSGK